MTETLRLIQYAHYSLKDFSSQSFLESQWILSAILKISPAELYQKKGGVISEKQKNKFLEKIEKRKQGWPLAYIMQEAYFFNRCFYIKPGVFVPRLESEQIVQKVLQLKIKHIRGIDFGSGSGNLALAIVDGAPACEAGR